MKFECTVKVHLMQEGLSMRNIYGAIKVEETGGRRIVGVKVLDWRLPEVADVERVGRSERERETHRA